MPPGLHVALRLREGVEAPAGEGVSKGLARRPGAEAWRGGLVRRLGAEAWRGWRDIEAEVWQGVQDAGQKQGEVKVG